MSRHIVFRALPLVLCFTPALASASPFGDRGPRAWEEPAIIAFDGRVETLVLDFPSCTQAVSDSGDLHTWVLALPEAPVFCAVSSATWDPYRPLDAASRPTCTHISLVLASLLVLGVPLTGIALYLLSALPSSLRRIQTYRWSIAILVVGALLFGLRPWVYMTYRAILFLSSPTSGQDAVAAPVQDRSMKPCDVRTVRASSGAEFARWLDAHGVCCAHPSLTGFDEYARRNWVFLVVTANMTKEERRLEDRNKLVLKFPTPRAVYPAAMEAPPGSVWLILYVFGDGRAVASEKCRTVTYAPSFRTDRASPPNSEIARSATPISFLPPGLTRLEMHLGPEAERGPVYLDFVPDPRDQGRDLIRL